MLVLHVLQGPDAGKRFPLPSTEPQLIGRSSEALAISDRSVSRRHAELTPDDGVWWIQDLDSQNGTFLNGRPVLGRERLACGDRIRCGDTVLVLASDVELPAADAADPPPIAPAASAVEARLPANAPTIADPRFRLLQELAGLASIATDRPRLVARALALVREEFHAERASLIAPPERGLVTEASDATASALPLAAPRAVLEEAMASGGGLLVLSAAADTGEPISALCAAVRTPESSLGALWIERRAADGAFDERHLRLVQAVATHVALLLRHGELVEATMARARLAAMGETVANLSHSIKNILQALRGGADTVELALARGDLAIAREGWPILARNLDRIHSLARNMLAYAKERALDLVPLNPNRLVEEIVALLATAAAHRRVRLTVELDPDMPAISIDPDAIHQAVMNLVQNGLEAAPDRGGAVLVRTRFRTAESAAEIQVSDDGPGIPDAIRERLFEPFASSKGQRGTGLGLAVSRAIAERHGGSLRVESTGPRGTTMTMLLPDRGPPDDADRTRGPQPIDESELGLDFGPPE